MTHERATLPAWRVERLAETGSTNDDVAARARAGEPPGLVLVAAYQRAGRGRLGRTWSAPPGASLLVSVLLPAGDPLHAATQAMALSARQACTELTGVEADLKWPNDLVIGSRKLAGILSEAVVVDGGVGAVVVGIGLNLLWPDPSELPGELAERLVALNHVVPVDRVVPSLDALLDVLLGHLRRRTVAWLDDPAALLGEYRAALATIGADVRVELPSGVIVGRAVDITSGGHLVVGVGDERVEVSVGDVVHLRPG